MSFYDPACDAESQPAPFGAVSLGAAASVEALENAAVIFRRNAWTSIGDPQLRITLLLL
jgi:hypothetical protein